MTYSASQFVVRDFTHLAELESRAADYSALKFGSDIVAKAFGYEMADLFFEQHKSILIADECVVVPSAFNVVEIAATILARHFMNRLNHHLTSGGHRQVEWTFMHRTMSYVADYSFMTREQRARLLKDDHLYINRDFIRGKVLLFVDDVTITGTHEQKISDFLRRRRLNNPHIFCYYARYNGDQADIEAALNHSGIRTVGDFIKLIREPNYKLVVRAVRFLLDGPTPDLSYTLTAAPPPFVEELYFACLNKKYDKVDSYRAGFEMIHQAYTALQTANMSGLEVPA